MKACAAVAGVIVGLAIVLAAALLIVPRLKAGNGAANSSPSNDPFGPPAQRVDAPKSDTAKLREEIDQKRIPFFHMLHEKYADQIDHASVLSDIDTLDLFLTKDDQNVVQWLVQNAIGPTARQYGFERVQFYVKNPVGTLEPYRVIAESSWDGSARWNTFLK